MTRRTRHNLFLGLAFISPWLVALSVWILGPAVMAFICSLTDFNVLNPPVFIGAGNYTDLATDQIFWKSLFNTLSYAAMALPLGTCLSLFLSILLNQKVVARPVFRTIFFLPSLVPAVALAVLWQWIFNGKFGVLNYFLHIFGITGPAWLNDPVWTKPALVLTGMWGVGYAIVIYLAALQDVPQELYEAAEIDGASWYHKVRHVTLPMISPVIYFNLIMGSIGVLQEFVTPYIMMGPDGQPARSTLFYAMYLYNHAFVYLNMGYACAMGVILFFMIAALTWLMHTITRKHVHYGGA
ncbi:MAG: sugar ABC transporter permease [Candidatus Sumerlaeota bacterium]|nr:sugar ABC transporter permease [Candidatus Sumerlaeota bacterium]